MNLYKMQDIFFAEKGVMPLTFSKMPYYRYFYMIKNVTEHNAKKQKEADAEKNNSTAKFSTSGILRTIKQNSKFK